MAKRASDTNKASRAKRQIGEEPGNLFTSGPSVLKGDVVFRKVASAPTAFLHPRDAFAKLKA
ncbi:hypothetical protein [Paenibacillus flagellatus]|uniref:Uncharacterized protein n=1 Tax=Paenibacillus flagellatus TaxID=2211139 RepID=A0A2V5K0B5_9BACL|nr:hypothetical protein [Paenibacillus flagellatus]PYI52578.1 hypothetical protein DLM86_20615 [Paenibacillus flagellatus]